LTADRGGGAADTPVDTGPLADLIGFKVRRVHNLLSHRWSRLAQSHSVSQTPVESGILLLIGGNPGIAHGRLAEILGVDASTLSQALSPMIAQGLVRREPAPDDKRARHMFLTDAGEVVKRAIAAMIAERRADVPGDLSTEETAELHRLLDKMLARG